VNLKGFVSGVTKAVQYGLPIATLTLFIPVAGLNLFFDHLATGVVMTLVGIGIYALIGIVAMERRSGKTDGWAEHFLQYLSGLGGTYVGFMTAMTFFFTKANDGSRQFEGFNPYAWCGVALAVAGLISLFGTGIQPAMNMTASSVRIVRSKQRQVFQALRIPS
jgi:hypothetical protein